MKTAQELLSTLRKGHAECRRIEAKRLQYLDAKSMSVYQTICAFANEPRLDGGWLLLGVEERPGSPERFHVVGIDDADKIQNDLCNACRSDKFTVSISPECETENLEGKTVLLVRVHESDHKPVGLKTKARVEIWRRRNNGDSMCNAAEERALLRESLTTEFDGSMCHRARMEDIDPQSVARFRALLDIHFPDAAFLKYDDNELLYSYGCTIEEEGTHRPTNAAIVLFGTQDALRRLFPMFHVDYILSAGTQWVENAESRYSASKDFRENIFSLAEKLPAYISSELPTRPIFSNHTIVRREEPLLPQKALREAIVNLLMHQDYQKHSPSQIRKYADRLELENPGYSLKPLHSRCKPVSYPRNPVIANIFHDIHFAEAKGSGFRVMEEHMATAGLSAPDFFSDRDKNSFCAVFSLHHFLKPEDLAWLAQFQGMALNDNQIRALVHVRQNRSITNGKYCQINTCGADDKKARQELHELCAKGALQKNGKGRWTIYVLPPDTADSQQGKSLAGHTGLSPSLKRLSPKRELFQKKDANNFYPSKTVTKNTFPSENFPGELSKQADLSLSIAPLSLETTKEEIPEDEKKYPTKMGYYKDTPHTELSKELVNTPPQNSIWAYNSKFICTLCQEKPCTAKELAFTMKMSIPTIKKYLRQLMDSGNLAQLYPDAPNHPKQAYIARLSANAPLGLQTVLPLNR